MGCIDTFVPFVPAYGSINYLMVLPYRHDVTITTANGPEFADHKWLAKASDAEIYFVHLCCIWEKWVHRVYS